VAEVLLVSRYPFIIRMLPGVSVMAVLQTLLDDQVTAAPVALCVSSTRADAEPLTPVALFQFAFAITPALSVPAIAEPLPTKWTPIAFALVELTTSVVVNE